MGAGARVRFFAGKGGVGKTTCAAAAALAAAEEGRRVLLVSTDPAHSLGDALAQRLAARPRRVAKARGTLDAVELDADAALERWLARRRPTLRTIADRGTYFDRKEIDRLLDLSLPGVDELVGLVELLRLAREGPHDDLVVDTAPTGHTLRLLATPDTLRRLADVLDDLQAKHRWMTSALGGDYQRDAADELIAEIAEEGSAAAALLRDPARGGFHWVTLPEELAVAESLRGLAALAEAEIPVTEVIVNRVTPPPPGPCALCGGRRATEREAVARLRAALPPGVALRLLPALETEPRGVAALAPVARALADPGRGGALLAARGRERAPAAPAAVTASLALAAAPERRLLLFVGKGGVGKTTCAAATALAVAAASPRRRVLLLSTDPAHSLADALGVPLGDDERAIPGAPAALRARELDAPARLADLRERYRDAVDELFAQLTGRSRLDPAYDRAVMHDLIDMTPPGLDELFGVLGVMGALLPAGGAAPAAYDLVVLDTAPTGHALRLLAMPEAAREWVKALLAILLRYRDTIGLGPLAGDLVEASRGLERMIQLVRDPARCRFVAVTRAAELPAAETTRLLAALERLGVAGAAVIVDALTPPGCARCEQARRREGALVAALAAGARRHAILQAPAMTPPPRGVEALRRFAATWKPT